MGKTREPGCLARLLKYNLTTQAVRFSNRSFVSSRACDDPTTISRNIAKGFQKDNLLQGPLMRKQLPPRIHTCKIAWPPYKSHVSNLF